MTRKKIRNVKVGKVNVRLNVLRDYDGDVRGYRLGDYYLMKHYTWGNSYEWIINDNGQTHYYTYEGDKFETMPSFKAGVEVLLDKHIEGIKLY